MEAKIFQAIEKGHVDIIRTLIAQGANINARKSEGNTLLHSAVHKQNEEIVRILIEAGVNVNLKNDYEETALFTALLPRARYARNRRKPSRSIVEMLLEAGADINVRSKHKWRGRLGADGLIFHEAASTGDPHIVKLFLDRKANAKEKDNYGCTALFFAAENVISEDPAIFELLLSAGIDVNSKCHTTALHCLAGSKPNKPVSLLKIVEVFAKYGAKFNLKDELGSTPVDIAFDESYTEAIEAFIKFGKVDVNAKVDCLLSRDSTPLHIACQNGDLSTVEFLLKNGANINSLDEEKATPLKKVLHSGVFELGFNIEPYKKFLNPTDEMEDNKIKVLKYLLKFNPDLNTITTNGNDILTPGCDDDGDLPSYLWKPVLEQVAKLLSIKHKIHSCLMRTVHGNSEYKKYLEKCNKELEILKTSKIYSDSNVTFYNLLLDDEKNLVEHAGNVNMVKELTNIMVYKKFPIYGDLIKERFQEALNNQKIQEQTK